MPTCPYFECLDFSPAKCEAYVGCEGCPAFSDCNHCGRQETLVSGVTVPCEHASGKEFKQN